MSDILGEAFRKIIVEGGRLGVFTPMYCFLARKPL